jgi:hypothetical protein
LVKDAERKADKIKSNVKKMDATMLFIGTCQTGNRSKTTANYGGLATKELLLEALGRARVLGCMHPPTVLVDSGTENLNADVDGLVDANLIDRLVAQIEIEFSNSMVENGLDGRGKNSSYIRYIFGGAKHANEFLVFTLPIGLTRSPAFPPKRCRARLRRLRRWRRRGRGQLILQHHLELPSVTDRIW